MRHCGLCRFRLCHCCMCHCGVCRWCGQSNRLMERTITWGGMIPIRHTRRIWLQLLWQLSLSWSRCCGLGWSPRRRGKLLRMIDMCLPLIRPCRGSDHAAGLTMAPQPAPKFCAFFPRATSSHGLRKTCKKRAKTGEKNVR